jgi:lipopolysaccharide biosynthesis glycosyltransferase
VIDYLYATDGRDFALTLLSAQSVRKHVPNARFHLIASGDWTPPNDSPIAWASFFSVPIDELKSFVRYRVEGPGAEFHWGWGACARWFVQRMPHIHHCIFLDSDILCLRAPRLKRVKTVAAVPSQNFNKGRHTETGDFGSKLFNKKKPLFESGMMVLNVDWMREVDFLSTIFDNAVETQQVLGKRFYAENSLLSRNFAGCIEKLPVEYNAGNNDVNCGLITEEETTFYHFHHETSGVSNKKAIMSAYAQRGGRMNIAYVVDDSAEQIARMWMSMRTVRQFNKAVRFYVISSRPLRGDFINLVCSVPKGGFAIYRNRPHTRFSDGTMFRFYLPRLPVDRVIYLDTDTNCHGSLEPLWEMTKRKGIGALHYVIPDKEPHAELKRKFYGKTYNNAGILALNLKHLRSLDFEAESLAWLPPPDMPTRVFFADETILNLRWKRILYPIPDAYNVKYPADHQGPKNILHFFAWQKELQIHDFAILTFVQNPRHSMYARIGLLQKDLEWLKKTLGPRR